MADTVPTETLTLNYEKVEWTYSKSDAEGDSFDFTATPEKQEVAMLLPAVQMAPDATQLEDSFDFTATSDEQEVALLLPAVQAAREAARTTDDGVQMGDGAVIFITDSIEAGNTAYEYKLDNVLITSYDTHGTADGDAGLRSDGELVQAVSEADMGGDSIL